MKNDKDFDLLSEFIELNPIETREIIGGINEPDKDVIICKLGQKVYLCASWEASCEKNFTHGCDGGFVSCGSNFTLTPKN